MKTVVFLRASNGFYGAERVIVGLAATLPALGWNCQLWILSSPDGSHESLLDVAVESGIETHVISCQRRFDMSAIRDIGRRLYRLRGSDVILHSHDVKSDLYGWLAARRSGIPVVSTVHGWTSDTPSIRFYELVDRLVLRRFISVICVSKAIEERLRASIRNLNVVANGVDTGAFSPTKSGLGKKSWGIPEGRFVFGIFARLTPEKGHENLLHAFSKVVQELPHCHLLITGSGPLWARLSGLIERLGIESHVSMVPAHSAIDQALHDIDCYVSASTTEGMPMIILEAMASGIPVIATSVGALPDLLSDNCGVLVQAGDAGQLAGAMSDALEQGDRMLDCADNALKKVRESYSLTAQTKNHSRIYDHVRRACH